MNDLEEQLRTDLRTATSDIGSELDPDALLRVGRRVRRNRVVRRLAVSVAAVLAVGAIGRFSLNSLIGGSNPAVVVATPSPDASSPSAPASPGTAQQSISMAGGFNGVAGAFNEVRVTATSNGTTITARFLASLDGTVVADATVTRQLDGSRPELVRLGSHGVVAVVPGAVRGQSLYGTDASLSGRATLDPLGATALVFLTEAKVRAPHLQLMWEDGGGALQSTLGPVPSARVTVDGEEVVVFRSEALDSQGLWGSWSSAVNGAKPSDMLEGGTARGEGTAPKEWRLTQVGMLPPGSTDVSLTLASADGGWAQAELPDGWVAVVAAMRSTSDKSRLVTSLSYTDAKGVRHSYPSK
ncbi:hypothetical protein [Propionicimonas sp.]|uniref:hypothetical protein n=1 Tax=Propionicimonas sp. TaxID=1955623 RepID=UPI0039E5DE21